MVDSAIVQNIYTFGLLQWMQGLKLEDIILTGGYYKKQWCSLIGGNAYEALLMMLGGAKHNNNLTIIAVLFCNW